MRRLFTILGPLAFFAGLAWAVGSLPQSPPGLTDAAFRHLSESGVTNPVTAVLLNYRGYDTLLEVAVLLLAVIATWLVAPRGEEETVPEPQPESLWILARLLAPPMAVGSGYFLWTGSHAPGGAFQAGALLGGALVLFLLAGVRGMAALCGSRWLLAAGLAVFLAAAVWPLHAGGSLLEYRGASAKAVILAVEAAATVSIGFTLAALFLGAPPPSSSEKLSGRS